MPLCPPPKKNLIKDYKNIFLICTSLWACWGTFRSPKIIWCDWGPCRFLKQIGHHWGNIYIKSPFVVHPFIFLSIRPSCFLRGNNSALGGHRALPNVANERYCNIVLIFCIFICAHACAHIHAVQAQCAGGITQLWVVTQCSQRQQMKGIAIQL